MTLQEYLTPDPSLREPRSCPEFMPDAPPSFTSREMSLHSAISVHGYTFIDGRKVWYESVLERCCAMLGRLRPDVAEVAEQPPAVTYVDDAGRERQHIFDFSFTQSAKSIRSRRCRRRLEARMANKKTGYTERTRLAHIRHQAKSHHRSTATIAQPAVFMTPPIRVCDGIKLWSFTIT